MSGSRVDARYLGACAIGFLGLAPYVVLSTAFVPLQKAVMSSLGAGSLGFALAEGFASGAYAVGAVTAAQFALRRRQREIFLLCEAVFVVTSVASAFSPDVVVFGVARVLQGLAAGGMLISSLPPLITRFGAGMVPLSAGVVDVGIFGSSTLGPLVGVWATHAGGDGWRWMLLVAAALGVVGWIVAWRRYESWDPPEPDARVDVPALALVAVVAGLAFAASSLVGAEPFLSLPVLGLFGLALAALVALLVVEARRSDPLIPVQALTTQLPVSGIFAAMLGGAVFVVVVEVMETAHLSQPSRMWPMPVGALLGAIAFWRLFVTKWMPVLVDAGVCLLGAGALVLLGTGALPVMLAALLLGFGAAATVSPGLFLAAMGLPSERLGRAFALVQLLRALATYAVAPVVIESVVKGGSGRDEAFVAMAVACAVGLVLLVVVPVVSGARLRRPDVQTWLDGDKGLPSPATATHLRPSVEDEDADPLLPESVRRSLSALTRRRR